MKVLITGATGFIGSNIAKSLLDLGIELIGTCRTTSKFDKCASFKDNIKWINTDDANWKAEVQAQQVNLLIHTAWGGIESGDRNNWDLQLKNFYFSKELYDLAINCKFNKVITLGSQAEYGSLNKEVNEETVPEPNDAYGAVKLLTMHYQRNLFEKHGISWNWIRVFSVFGPGENKAWLIPYIIQKLQAEECVELTKCEQLYNYLYIDDFCTLFNNVVLDKRKNDGVFNICNTNPVVLKDLVTDLATILNRDKTLLQFGAIPYREGQNMLIHGSNTKFMQHFMLQKNPDMNLFNGLKKTINHYKTRTV